MSWLFRNYDELALTHSRKLVLDLIETGIASVLPENALRSCVRFDPQENMLSIENRDFPIGEGRLFVIGAGKAAASMAETFENIVSPESITWGYVNTVKTSRRPRKIEVNTASHPIPDFCGLNGTKMILEMKSRFHLTKNDRVVCLLSGGASALLPMPMAPVTMEDKQYLTGRLLRCGADINEINIVRKHLSNVKGGRLAEHLAPARIINLIVSDVIGDPLESIGSGPSVPDTSTFQDAIDILKKYNTWNDASDRVRSLLNDGIMGIILDTPKQLSNTDSFIVANNSTALNAMASHAQSNGLRVDLQEIPQTGDTGEVAEEWAIRIEQMDVARPIVLIAGGETTLRLPENPGRGGRNLHFMLKLLNLLGTRGIEFTAISAATDGADYTTGTAGAIIDNDSLGRSIDKSLNIDPYLNDCDSLSFFEQLRGSLVLTGFTGTNVCDIRICYLASSYPNSQDDDVPMIWVTSGSVSTA